MKCIAFFFSIHYTGLLGFHWVKIMAATFVRILLQIIIMHLFIH